MTRLDILKSRLRMVDNNLCCYSQTVEADDGARVLVAKAGYEKEYLEAMDEMCVLYDWIYDLGHIA